MNKEKVANSLVAASLFASIHSPVLAQPFTEDEVGTLVIAMVDIKELPPIETSNGMAIILIERYCNEDASGGLDISLTAGEFDPKKSPLWIEAHPINSNGGILAEVTTTSAVQGFADRAKINVPKDRPFMIQIKEKVKNITNIIKEFDVVHYCRQRTIISPPVYAYSDDFQTQLINEESDLPED